MSWNSWNQTLSTSHGDGTALTNTTTPTSILAPQAKLMMPAGYLKEGDVLRIKAYGRISTAAASPGTLTLDVRAGASTVLFNGGASGTLVTSATNLTWSYEAYLTVRSLGTAGTILGVGELKSAALSAATPIQLLPASAPAVGSAVDLTSSFLLDLYATWSVASASNSIQVHASEIALLT